MSIEALEAPASPPHAVSPGLEIEDVVVSFGGVIAVDGLSLRAPVGGITGLIGPNGAGKTTTFNVCSGLQAPTSGRVSWRGEDVTSSSTSHRAQLGLGRTFQHVELFDSMTVAENIALGCELGLAGSNPLRHVLARRGDDARIRRAAEESMQRCGIDDLADRRAGSLSTGHRRLVELARALAGSFELLLLDEPGAGLDADETDHFAEILAAVRRERGVGMLIVEHDVPFVLSLTDYVYVLDFGRLIFEGTPDEVRRSTFVRDAYLGTSADGD